MLIILNNVAYFDQILQTYAYQHCLTTDMHPHLMGDALLSISQTSPGQLVKMLITLELHGIFRICFAHLFIITLSSHWYRNR